MANAYIDALGHLDAETLKLAWRDVKRQTQNYRWPTIGTIIAATNNHDTSFSPAPLDADWKKTLLKHMDAVTLHNWLHDARLSLKDDHATLLFNQELKRKWCASHYSDLLKMAIRKHHPQVRILHFETT